MNLGDSFQRTTDGLFGFLPNLFGFLVLLLVGYIVARVVKKIVATVLDKAGIDKALRESDANQYVEKVAPGAKPSSVVAAVVFWFVFIFFLLAAVSALGIPAVTGFMNDVLGYLPNVIVAILIFVLAALLSGVVAKAVATTMGDTPTGKITATVVPALIMVIAVFMILQQLRIAEEIVQIAFAATIGALALGLALAFGLGGRGVAQQMLEDAYRKGREQKDQVKEDLQQGRERAESKVDEATDDDQSTTSTPSAAPAGAGPAGTSTGQPATGQPSTGQPGVTAPTATYPTSPSHPPTTP